MFYQDWKKLSRVPWSSVPIFGQSRTFYYLVSNLIYLIFGLLLILLMIAGLNSPTHSKFASRLMTTMLFSKVHFLVVVFHWLWFALAQVLWRARALHHALLFPLARTRIPHYIVSKATWPQHFMLGVIHAFICTAEQQENISVKWINISGLIGLGVRMTVQE